MALQIAPATTAGELTGEQLTATLDDQPVPADEVPGDHGGRTHLVTQRGRPAGHRLLRHGAAELADPGRATKAEAITYLRQSRYCPSDELAGFAANELRDLPAGPDRPPASPPGCSSA